MIPDDSSRKSSTSSRLKKNSARSPATLFLKGIAAGIVIAGLFVFPYHRYMDYPEKPQGDMAAQKAGDPEFKTSHAVVVELFTSQSCYSCPPAEAMLRDLSQRSDVMTLEYHVDYWDDLVYGSKGQWKDRFSKPEWTRLQKDYARHVFGHERVFTPQLVIDGHASVTGASERKTDKAIGQAHYQRKRDIVLSARVQEGKVVIRIDEGKVDEKTSLTLVKFIRRAVTRVEAGENKGKELASYNIVTDALSLPVPVSAQVMADMKLEEGEGCAVLLRDQGSLRIRAARFCDL